MGSSFRNIGVLIFGVLLLMFCAEARADVTYSYLGKTYTSISGAYSGSMRVTGSFSLSASLSPNLPMTDISPSVLGYSFFDGVQTLTDGNSEIIAFKVSTNDSGEIKEWRVVVWETPVTGVVGGLVFGIDTISASGFMDDKGFTGGTCSNVIAGVCVEANASGGDIGSIFSANPADAGSWTTVSASQGAVSVPAIQGWRMIVLAACALLLGGLRLRPRVNRAE